MNNSSFSFNNSDMMMMNFTNDSSPLPSTSTYPAPNSKRRLSDDGTGDNPERKPKKLIGQDGKPLDSGAAAAALADGSNKTKTGRFKPGAPVDLDEQCGVVADGKGPCSRSLTCKTHGMAAKRAVQGRSLPYDEALAEFQKKKEKMGIMPKRKADKDKDKDKDNSNSKDIKVDIVVGEGPAPMGKKNAGGGMHFPGDGGIAYPQLPVGGLANVPGGNPAPLLGGNAISQQQQQQQQQQSRPPQTQLKANIQAQLGAGGNGSLSVPSGGGNAGAAGPLGGNGSSKPASSSTGGVTSKPASSSTSTAAPPQAKAGSSSSKPKSSTNVVNGQSATGPAGTSASASASTSAASLPGGGGSTTGTTKKKSGSGEKKRTTGKSSKASKADLILGEIDDPPESTSTTLAAGETAGNTALILEEEAPDSDDELEQLLLAVGRFSRPRPLAVHGAGLSLGNEARAGGRYQQRYRESFMTAFTGRSMTAKSAG